MAGTVKVNVVQLGDSATATQNLTIRTNIDGTFTLARGNAGATTQDILTIDANGRVATPQTVVAFSAYKSTIQSLPNTTFNKVLFQTEEFDTTSAYDNATNHRFQPLVAGYYHIIGAVQIAASASTQLCSIYKNGVEYKRGSQSGAAANSGWQSVVSALVYLNGSTDYVEIWSYQNAGGAVDISAASHATYFQGILINKA